jgi:hypothetical protein
MEEQETLKYVLDAAKNLLKDNDKERVYLEQKLHNFMYIWLAIVITMCSFFGKTVNVFDTLITPGWYVSFFTYEFIFITIVTFLFLRVYVYKGKYAIINSIALNTNHNGINTLENLMNQDLDEHRKCITRNSTLNILRNKNFNLLKRVFAYVYLPGKILLLVLIIIFN